MKSSLTNLLKKDSGKNKRTEHHGDLLSNVLNGLDTNIFITDIDTNEIVFFNNKTASAFSLDDTNLGEPCWKTFRKKDAPCDFCRIPELKSNPGEVIVWDEYVPHSGIHLRHSERLVQWKDGRTVHLQEVIDITDIKLAEVEYKRQLEQQQLISCITQSFISDGDTEECFYEAMEQTGIITRSDHVTMVIYNEDTSSIIIERQWVMVNGENKICDDEFFNGGLKDEIVKSFINSKKPFVSDNRFNDNAGLSDNNKIIQAYLCVPLYLGEKFAGALVLSHEMPREWSENDIRFVTLVSHIFANVKSRQKSELQLGRLSTVVENLPSVIVSLDDDYNIEYANPSFEKIIGYSVEEIIKKDLGIFLDSEDDSYLTNEIFPKVMNGNTETVDVTIQRKNGENAVLELSIFTIPNATGSKSIALNAVDATERKQLNEALSLARDSAESASNAKSTFLSNISHEIRTPMTAIMGMLEISMKSDDIEHIKDCLAKMQTSSTHLLNILNDVLDMSKIESGTFEMFEETFNLEKIISDLMIVIGVKANEKDQDILVNINRDVPVFLYGDYMRLSQVIINIISNAIKFSPNNSKVYLDVALLEKGDSDALIGFSVRDEGIGMDKDKIEYIFQPFRQADNSITKRYGGTGLGLAISKNIVEQMNGNITVVSEPGNGSTFCFTVRLKIAALSGNNDDWSYNGKVLIVDDSKVTRTYIGKILDEHNVKYVEADNGQKAIDIIKRDKIGFALIDYRMIGMNGIQTAIALKEISDYEIKVALISISDMMNVYNDAKKAGVDYFLQKPILNSTLGEMFTNHQNKSKKKRYKNDFGPVDFSGKKFMIVEDSTINREIARFILEEAGGTVFEAENGEVAVDMFYKNPTGYDCILMDIQMPIMDGYTATSKIRESKLPFCSDIPIIAMTANVFSEDVAASMKAKLNAHIGKPINTAEMYRIIKENLNTSS